MFKYSSLNKLQKRDLAKIVLSSVILIVLQLTNFPSEVDLVFYLIAYFVVGFEVLQSAVHGIRGGQVFDENFLMAIATIGAFLLGEYTEGVFVMLFYQLGELFESMAVANSRKSIASLLEYAPDEARVLRDGKEEIVFPEEVEIGERILVYSGEKIPLDGIVKKGSSALNMAFLTGESLPVDVEEGDEVHSGSINSHGVLEIEVMTDYEDSTISKILELIEESSDKKSVMENFITRFARYYTPIVVISALFLAVIPSLITGTWATWVKRALIFLVVSCPCALVISVPLSFFGGIGRASRSGILVKGSNYLEMLSMVDTVVFDKTGTLTEGVFEIVEENEFKDKYNWKEIAGAIESYSNHPIAQSIVESYGDVLRNEIDNVEEIHGGGLVGEYNGKKVAVGNERLMRENNIEIVIPETLGTVSYIGIDGELVASLVIADVIKEDARIGLKNLKEEGVSNLVLLTGDRKDVGEDVGRELGIDEIHSELLPEDKVSKFEKILERSTEKNRVAFVGDGINDAPVLRRSDVGVAMGALGSDAAIEASDIVLMDDKLSNLSLAMKIAKKTVAIAKQNIVLAIGVKVGVLILSVFGLATMWLAIFADVGVMFIAVLNSLRAMR